MFTRVMREAQGNDSHHGRGKLLLLCRLSGGVNQCLPNILFSCSQLSFPATELFDGGIRRRGANLAV